MNNKISNGINKNLLIAIIIVFMVFLPILSLAQEEGDTGGGGGGEKIINPIRSTSLTGLLQTVLEGFIKLMLPVVVVAIVYSGFLFVTAQGNSEKITKARTALTYTVIGAAILIGSWGIAQLIKETVDNLAT